MCDTDSMKSNQAQSVLRKMSKIDLEQDRTQVEQAMRSCIGEGDKLSLAQQKVAEASDQMQSNIQKIVANSTDVNVSHSLPHTPAIM